MSGDFKIVWRKQGAPHDDTQSRTVESWAEVGGLIGAKAQSCDSILVYCNGQIVLRYDNDGIN